MIDRTTFQSSQSTPATEALTSSAASKGAGKDFKKALQDFESYIWGTIFNSMQESIPKSEIFGEGQHEGMFTNMMYQEFAKSIPKSLGNNSLSEVMSRQMSKLAGIELDADKPAPTLPRSDTKSIIPALPTPTASDSLEPSAPAVQLTPTVEEASELLNRNFGTSEISSAYGWRMSPFNRSWQFHQGVDIPMGSGTEVHSPVSGTVAFSGAAKGYGRMAIVKTDDGHEMRFAHAEKLLCKQGDKIVAGQVICLSGSSGRSTGPHLHLEVRKDDNPLNPLTYLANNKKGSSFANLRP